VWTYSNKSSESQGTQCDIFKKSFGVPLAFKGFWIKGHNASKWLDVCLWFEWECSGEINPTFTIQAKCIEHICMLALQDDKWDLI